jgi:N-acetylneuraminic acid mutarotase
MDDLKRRFSELDEIDAPDVWSDGAERRPRLAPELGSSPRQGRQRITAALVAIVVFIVAGAFAFRIYQRNAGVEGRPSPSFTDPLGSIQAGWTRLPSPPVSLPGAAAVWAGHELIVWGGATRTGDSYAPTTVGYAYDPSTDSWSALPPAPIPGRYVRAVWTGTEAVFVGVGSGGSDARGEAFDPITGSWRVIAEAPLASRPAVLVWTGSRIIAWGGGPRGAESNVAGAAYDPKEDSWRPIADAPIGLNAASGVWTGSQMIVFGSALDGGNHAATRFAIGELYDPPSDSWRPIADSSLSPQASVVVWNGDTMVAYDYQWKAAAYDVETDSWRGLGDLPFKAGECYPDGVPVGRTVFAFGCGEVATLAPRDRTWTAVHGGMTAATIGSNGQTPYLLWRFATLVPAGEVVFLAAEGLTITGRGPCYGCPGSPLSFWAYRPA